jgi:shikimate dehydrogenase
LGAGGAARAVVAGLIEAEIAGIHIANRTRARAEELASVMVGATEVIDWQDEAMAAAAAAAGLIVNTTPMGTAHTRLEEESPLQERHFRPGVVAFDLVYNPPLTPFLAAAKRAGAVAVSGLDMLVYQGAESIRLWTRREPPLEVMRAAAQAALRGATDVAAGG